MMECENEKKQEEKEKEQQSPTKDIKPALKTHRRTQPVISATSYLPIFTVPLPPAKENDSDSNGACPICLNSLANPTACQTGYVFCYVCVFHWLNGEHQRQLDFMNGESAGAAWEEDGYEDGEEANGDDEGGSGSQKEESRHGKWESGKGRCPVTGRRVLSGTEGLRRVLI